MLTPIEDDPPVNGPSTPILMGSAANAPAEKAIAPATARSLKLKGMSKISKCLNVSGTIGDREKTEESDNPKWIANRTHWADPLEPIPCTHSALRAAPLQRCDSASCFRRFSPCRANIQPGYS